MRVSRREFLIASAFASGGLYLSRDWSLPVPASDRVRIGVIGDYVRSTGLKKYLAIPGIQLVALSDLSITSAKPSRISRRGLTGWLTSAEQPVAYADWRRLIDRPDIDALFVSGRGSTQSKISEAAFDTGKDVLLERPGRSVDQLSTISGAAESKHRLAAHSYGAQFVGISDERSGAISAIQGLTTARAQHSLPQAYDEPKSLDPRVQRREFLLNPVEEFDYARAVLGVGSPSSVSCVAMGQPVTRAVTRAAVRFEFDAADGPKAIELDIAGNRGPSELLENRGSFPIPNQSSIVFAGQGASFAVGSINNPNFTLATWSNFISCVRSREPADLVAPLSELRDSLKLLQLAEGPCESGVPLFVESRHNVVAAQGQNLR